MNWIWDEAEMTMRKQVGTFIKTASLYAAEHIPLCKVGGGYMFIHHLLLEYFASLDTPPTPDAARAKEEGH
jgi:hypothetical protein